MLFGEWEMERRDKQRMLMLKLDAKRQLEKLMKAHEEVAGATAAANDAKEEILEHPFYAEDSEELLDARIYLFIDGLDARIDIAKYSILRAALRLQRARRKRDEPSEDVDAEIDCALKHAEIDLGFLFCLFLIGNLLFYS